MNYIFSYENPHLQLVNIEFIAENNEQLDILHVQLPAWRPGRYELGNFAKNIKNWQVSDDKGNQLEYKKIKKDLWQVNSKGAEKIHVKYSYYAAELNAGSTWIDEQQLYVNPVNCCVFIPERIHEQCELTLNIPFDFRVATSLLKISSNKFSAKDFHELADSPFIASATILHNMFVYEGTEFHMWFQGVKTIDWSKLFTDFFVFTDEQYRLFDGFPVDEYHYFFQILPYPAYHGVEHQKSTVITLGPTCDVFELPLYNELLGVSSHELFHTWNIKSIRPVEMMPYNYAAENYSRLGFVAEGFTTYYGDLMLFRSRVFDEKEYFKTFQEQLKKHFDNPGRHNMSVADSSFDTWLDGYVPGVPGRKVSIYTEGCLASFMLDVIIRRATKNQKSLDDVLRSLYNDFGKTAKGYSEEDVLKIAEKISGISLEKFFKTYIYGTEDYCNMLEECLEYLGLEIIDVPSSKYSEARLGIKVLEESDKAIVKNIYPGSVAENAGLKVNDKIIAVNGNGITGNFNNWCSYFAKQEKEVFFTVISSGLKKEIRVGVENKIYYKNYFLKKLNTSTIEMTAAFNAWSGISSVEH
jgi:predicted metalloprotease with PDZ domain